MIYYYHYHFCVYSHMYHLVGMLVLLWGPKLFDFEVQGKNSRRHGIRVLCFVHMQHVI